MDAVTEDRHIGHRRQAIGFRHDEQFVDGTLVAVEHDLGFVGLGIEEQDLRAHLVDRDHAARFFFVSHLCFFPECGREFSRHGCACRGHPDGVGTA
jgi:hypothetical protein